MTEEMSFFMYLVEHYAEYKSKKTREVLKEWDELNLTTFIYDMYEIYHIERLQNAFDDIDSLIQTGKTAW